MKLFFLDVETSGLDAVENDIIHMAGEFDGEEFSFKCNVLQPEKITKEALDVNGFTREQIASYDSPRNVFLKLQRMLDKKINKFDPLDKAMIIAHNASFDKEFLYQFWDKHVDRKSDGKPVVYFGNYFFSSYICTMSLYAYAFSIGKMKNCGKFKLSILCEKNGIKLANAHNAVDDVMATKELYYKIKEALEGVVEIPNF